MDWSQVLAIIGANIGIFFWLRTESSSDRRQMQQESASDRRDILQLIRNMEQENKDFHARMAVLEERYLQILTQKS